MRIEPAIIHGVVHGRELDFSPVSGKEIAVNNIIYIIGLVVVVIAVLSFFGLR